MSVEKYLLRKTESRRLRNIEALYKFADNLNYPGYLDDALTDCDIQSLDTVLEAYFISLRNRPKLNESLHKQWRSGLFFVKDVITRISKSGKDIEDLHGVEFRLIRLESVYGQLRIQRTRQPEILRSLPAEVVGNLYEMLDPESPTNPFTRTKTKWTVFLAFVIMLHQGLRRGELLLLPVNAVNNEYDMKFKRGRNWINVQNSITNQALDPRYNKPSIKTIDSIRQVPVSELTANLIQTYVENYRGKPNHPFLLNSQWNTPVSHSALTSYFARLSENLTPEARKNLIARTGKDTVDPHSLRHTSAVVRLNQLINEDIPMDVALQKMRIFFGWSRESDMPLKYAKAVFEDRLSNVWSQIQDDRIELIKSIPKGV